MRIRTASDVLYTTIAWLPLLGLAVGVVYVLGMGLFQLESLSFGTEFLIGNDETENMIKPLGHGGSGLSDEELLLDALNSGNVDTMSAALDQVGAEREALAATAG